LALIKDKVVSAEEELSKLEKSQAYLEQKLAGQSPDAAGIPQTYVDLAQDKI